MTELWMQRCVAVVAVLLAASPAAASAVGEWVTEGDKARVRIEPCAARAEQLCGTITWSYRPADAPDGPLVDVNNDDPALRTRPIVGLPLLQGFEPAGPEAWDGGTIYDPEGGKVYKSKFRLKGADTLEVDGCVLFFCQSQTWTRYRG
jgi:uncharacterized protein (DUF2147 family)